MIDDVVCMDVESTISNDYRIKPNVDSALLEISEKIIIIEKKMNKNIINVADELGLEPHKSLKQEYANHRGHYYRVTIKEAKVVTNNHNFKIIETLKDGIRFSDSRLDKLSEKFSKLNDDYNKIQFAYIQDLLEIASSYGGLIHQLGNIVALLDSIISLAMVVNQSPHTYIRPQILDEQDEKFDGIGRRIILKGSRHPCLESICDLDMAASMNSFIPNDVQLLHDKSHFVIITGPNMGGKSTYIRQIGMCVLMAQIGCFVPCEFAQISIVDKIFTRIGANDYLMRGMSTFMAEITDISFIMNNATNKSLIMIDELGRGTSTFDGFGLAWAISENIITKLNGCFTLFATHFTEMTQLDKKYSGIKNMHLKAILDEEKQTLTMLYKVENGSSDKSFGLHVANITKFPKQVIDNALLKLNNFENNCKIIIIKNKIYLAKIKDEILKEIIKCPLKLNNFIEKLKNLDKNCNNIVNQILNIVKNC